MPWDRGIDYEYSYAKLSGLVKRGRRWKTRCYAAVLLIQLRNGARISEACNAFIKFLKTGEREVTVNVAKHRKPEQRIIIIPDEAATVRTLAVEHGLDKIEPNVLANRVKVFCIRKLGINTHSLRYAFITMLAKTGVNPAVIAKITKHKRLDMIVTYIQTKEAERILKELE